MQEEVVGGVRLSLQQRRLWLLQQQQKSQPFRAQCAYRLCGALDPVQLYVALEQVLNRFDILRTSFSFLPGVALPVQVIKTPAALAFWRECDFSEETPTGQEQAVTTLFAETLDEP